MNEEKVIFIYDETKENIESKILKLFKQFSKPVPYYTTKPLYVRDKNNPNIYHPVYP